MITFISPITANECHVKTSLANASLLCAATDQEQPAEKLAISRPRNNLNKYTHHTQ